MFSGLVLAMLINGAGYSCVSLPPEMTVAVPRRHQAAALQSLGHENLLPLTDGQAAELLDRPARAGDLSRRVLGAAIRALKRTEARETDYAARTGDAPAWTGTDNSYLTDLESLRTEKPLTALRPYLTRATWPIRGRSFTVMDCGVVVDIEDYSLRPRPPAAELALIFFLPVKPDRIHDRVTATQGAMDGQ
jgi:hypothetical protein